MTHREEQLQYLIDQAREISQMDKSSDAEGGYAHALGKCNGKASLMLGVLDSLLRQERALAHASDCNRWSGEACDCAINPDALIDQLPAPEER